MEYTKYFNFALPSRDTDDVADINVISENFRKVDAAIVDKTDGKLFSELTDEMIGYDIHGFASPSAVVNYTNDKLIETSETLKQYADETSVNMARNEIANATLKKLYSDMTEANASNGIPAPYAVVDYVNRYAELKKEWEVIPVGTNELSEDAAQWITQVELYGDTTKGVRVMLLLPPNTTLPNSRVAMAVALNKLGDSIERVMTVRAEGWKISKAQTVCVFDIVPRAGVWDVEIAPYQKTVDTVQGNFIYNGGDKVRYVTFKTNDTYKLPAGTSINVWGLK